MAHGTRAYREEYYGGSAERASNAEASVGDSSPPADARVGTDGRTLALGQGGDAASEHASSHSWDTAAEILFDLLDGLDYTTLNLDAIRRENRRIVAATIPLANMVGGLASNIGSMVYDSRRPGHTMPTTTRFRGFTDLEDFRSTTSQINFEGISINMFEGDDPGAATFFLHFEAVNSGLYIPRNRDGSPVHMRDALRRWRADSALGVDTSFIEVAGCAADIAAWLNDTPNWIEMDNFGIDIVVTCDEGFVLDVPHIVYRFANTNSYHLSYTWGMDRATRNRLMHALNGNGKGKKHSPPVKKTCITCGSIFHPAEPHFKRCSHCVDGGRAATAAEQAVADMGLGGADAASPPPSPQPSSATAPSKRVRDDSIASDSSDFEGSSNDNKARHKHFGPTDAGRKAASRADPPKMKPLWRTLEAVSQDLISAASVPMTTRTAAGDLRDDTAACVVAVGAVRSYTDVEYIVTFDHNAYNEEYDAYAYHRTADLQGVVVNGIEALAPDWLYTVGKVAQIGEQRYIATKVASTMAFEGGRMISVDTFTIKPTELPISLVDRYQEHVAKDARGVHVRYRAYKGANQTAIICGNEPVQIVETGTFMECGRYFVSPEASRVAEATIRGSLKNNARISDDEMDALIRFYSGKHQRFVVRRNAAIGGRKALWNAARDAHGANYDSRPWWMPSIVWYAYNPYGDGINSFGGAILSTLLVLFLLWACNGAHGLAARVLVPGLDYLLHMPGQINATNITERTTMLANDTYHYARGFVVRKPPELSISADAPLYYGACGQFNNYVEWLMTAHDEAGWRVEDAKCCVKYECMQFTLMFTRWAHRTLYNRTWADWHVMFAAPVYEEFVKHVGRSWTGITRGVAAIPFIGNSLSAGYGWFRGRRSDAAFCVLMFIIMTEAAAYGLPRYIPTMCMHIAAFWQPRWLGIIIHVLWNCWAVVTWGIASYQTSTPAGAMALLGETVMSVAALGVARAYRKIEPVGVDSEFGDVLRDPIAAAKYPMKKESDLHFRPTTFQRGRSRLYALLQPFVYCASFAASQGNILHSLAGRVLKDTPRCIRSLSGVESCISAMSNKMGGVTAGDPEEWAAKFPAPKRARYLQALLVLSVIGFSAFEPKLLGSKNKWDHRSCFLKHEVNLMQPEKTIVGNGRTYRIACSDPRTIQASADEIQAAVGPFFVAAGERASCVFDGSADSCVHGWRVCAGFGRTKAEVAAIMRDMIDSGQKGIVDCGDDAFIILERRVYAIDAARWDAHVGPELLYLKRGHLRKLGLHPRLINMLDALVHRRGSYKGSRVKFSVHGDVASGDADTLYWNTICGIAVIMDSFHGVDTFEEFAKRSCELGIEYELAASGSRSAYDARLDFCSCVFVPCSDGWTLAPKLGRSLMKLSHSANTNLDPGMLLAGKIQGLSHDLATYPEIVCALRSILPTLPRAGPIQESYHAVGHAEPASLEDRRAFFSDRYGVEYLDVVHDVRGWVRRSAADGHAGDLWRLARLVEVDYGKTPLPPLDVMPALADPERLTPRRNFLIKQCRTFALVLIAFWLVGWPVKESGESITVVDAKLSLSTHEYTQMSKNGKRNNNNKSAGAKPPARPKPKGRAKPRPRASNFKGDGMYQMLGPLVKATVKAAIPSALQTAAQRIMPNVTNFKGSGDYVTNDIVHAGPVGVKKGLAGVPVTKFTHSEFIEDIVVPATPTVFTSKRYNLNPATSSTYPWLNRLAALYTKYKFTKLLFEFRTSTSNYAQSGSLGTVIMAPQYNVEAQPFPTKQIMEAATHCVSSATSNSIIMGFECAKKDASVEWYSVLNDATMTVSQFTDPGYVTVATSGLPGSAGQVLGELWVHYSIDLIEPYISNTVSSTVTPTPALQYTNPNPTLVDALSAGPFGLQGSNLGTYTVGYPAANRAVGIVGSPASTNTSWDFACNGDGSLTIAGTAYSKALAFRQPGTYRVSLSFISNGNWTTTTGSPLEVSFLNGSGTVFSGNNNSTNPFYKAASTLCSYFWVIVVDKPYTVVTTTKGSGWTGNTTATMSSLVVDILKID